jgi:hypothetical protein
LPFSKHIIFTKNLCNPLLLSGLYGVGVKN